MSFNPNFYNYTRSNFTFQNNYQVRPSYPLPPPPPPPITPHMFTPEISDQDFVKKFENLIPLNDAPKGKTNINISSLREEIKSLISAYKDIHKQHQFLVENMEILSEDEWRSKFKNIEVNKNIISGVLVKLGGSYLDLSRKILAKRSAKRMRLKRLRQEKQQEKRAKAKELAERSRLIDENLQKIKDSIQKAKQEEEAKLHADVVLRDVVRKKNEAKKCISKLEALVKLRQARQNTAKGRGEKVSDTETNVFTGNIDKLKSMWILKLSQYEAEENELRLKLQDGSDIDHGSDPEKLVLDSLHKWRELLFGGQNPQVDFHGDVHTFITVRRQWDRYLSSEGSPLPIGWVLPKNQH